MNSKSLPLYLLETKKLPSQLKAVKYKTPRSWKSISWKDHFELCQNLGAGLISLNLKPNDKVGILSQTRFEWELIDMGALGCSGVTVPIYQSYRPEELEYIVNDSQIKILFCEDSSQLDKWNKIKANCPSVKSVILIDGEADDSYTTSWSDLLSKGEDYLTENPNIFSDSCRKVSLKQIATVIYTSGTTGNPKGVVLTHKQIMSELTDLFAEIEVNEKDCTLTFLPFAHIVGRVEMWGHIYKKYTLGYAESIDKIKKNLITIKPTIMIAVPRIFEKIYNGILSQIETNSSKEKVFNWAISVGKQISQKKMNKEPVPLPLIIQFKLAEKLVFNKISEKLGGRLRFAISGGAPLSKQIGEFFHAAGLLLLEGYGLSETTAAICVNTPLSYCFGTVGKPMGDVDIKIAADGEILVKSDKVMVEYYNNPEATKEVFTDGYFHTGDIGEFTDKGFIKITDRKKDLIKTAGGKYVAPQKLENLLKLNPYISNILIHGDQKKYIVALITVDPESIKLYALNNEISYSDYPSLLKSDSIKNLIRETVAEVNSQLASFETVKNFTVLENDFTVENGELTPSLKVKRKLCDKRYAQQINDLYGTDRSSL